MLAGNEYTPLIFFGGTDTDLFTSISKESIISTLLICWSNRDTDCNRSLVVHREEKTNFSNLPWLTIIWLTKREKLDVPALEVVCLYKGFMVDKN
jgi:hypothetical protein